MSGCLTLPLCRALSFLWEAFTRLLRSEEIATGDEGGSPEESTCHSPIPIEQTTIIDAGSDPSGNLVKQECEIGIRITNGHVSREHYHPTTS